MQDESTPTVPDFESYPLTRPEYITAIVHLYRGEVHRSQVWRTRLDTTTNWAVVTTAAMITFTFGDPSHHHIILLLSNLLITVFLCHEARRFRYFAVYRARVRMMEENFYLPLLTRRLESPMKNWSRHLATDLDQPTFKTTFFQAIGFRLHRNYFWIFTILILGWVLKLSVHPTEATSLRMVYDRMAVGAIPAGVIFAIGLAFVALIVAALAASYRSGMPVDEIRGLEKDLAHWKV